jgi:hypothetical protein
MQGAAVENYNGLIEALAARKAHIGLSDESLDAMIGWASGYTGKLMGVTPSKRLGIATMFECAQALGLEITLREIPDAVEKIQQRCGKRDERRVVRANVRMSRLPWLIKPETASEMGKLSQAKFTPEQRQCRARKAVQARWKKRREERRAKAKRS